MDFNPAVAAIICDELDSSGSGDPADRPDLHGDLPGLPAALGRGLARIHALALPHDQQPSDVSGAIESRLTDGSIDPSTFPEPYDRYEAGRLVEIWSQTELPTGYRSSPTVLVGGPAVARTLLSQGEISGFVGEVGLIGDPHLDLATMHHSIHSSLGPEAVFGFYEAYGADPNLVMLDRCILAGLLLGWIG